MKYLRLLKSEVIAVNKHLAPVVDNMDVYTLIQNIHPMHRRWFYTKLRADELIEELEIEQFPTERQFHQTV